MLPQVRLQHLEDCFLDLGKRPQKGVYFVRLNGYSPQVHAFLRQYYETARAAGAVIEGRLQNPTPDNLRYYQEIMGNRFVLDRSFLDQRFAKWLPRMNASQRKGVTDAVYATLEEMRRQGKNDNMLNNAYTKFMCWLYYKFERVAQMMGQEKVPKIWYEGQISQYELLLFRVLSQGGCDILLLQKEGDGAYLKTDPQSAWSQAWTEPGLGAFPEGFGAAGIRKEMQEEASRQRLYGSLPKQTACTNVWLSGELLEDIRKDPRDRGTDGRFYYNCFCRMEGTEEKVTYMDSLFQLQQQLKRSGRRVLILSKEIPVPTPDELAGVRRGTYSSVEQMASGLSANLSTSSPELRTMFRKAFLDLVLEEAKRPENNLNRLTSRAVYLLCWLKRYQGDLFSGWKEGEVACFLYMGGCRTEFEALFCRFLARLPVDVMIFTPEGSGRCQLADPLLFVQKFEETLAVSVYPQESSDVRVGTVGFHAEQELDNVLYQDGMYRDRQYSKAVTVSLQTMYEEIAILWPEEVKFRSGFRVTDGVVNLPVIYSKVSGVKDGDVREYWSSIKRLLTPETLLITKVPDLTREMDNPIKPYVTEFFRNGKLQRKIIREHKAYPYSFLREEMQEHLLDKLQLLIDSKRIKGTLERGTEYTILAVALNLKKEILQQIQRFDFTGRNPKVVFLIPGEERLSLEDTIASAYLNLVGFDVVFFVPTGYRSVEQYMEKYGPEEVQAGDYLFNLEVPNFASISVNRKPSWRERLFGKK